MSEELRDTPDASTDPRQGSIVPPVDLDRMHPEQRPQGLPWWIITVVVAGIVIGIIGIARAAERPAPGPHAITIYYAGKDYDSVQRTHHTISSPYESWEACTKAMKRIRIVMNGARIQCDPV